MPTRLSTPANRSLETADAEPLVLLRRPIHSGSLLRRGVTTSAVGDSDGFKASKLLLQRQIDKGSSLRRGASSPFNPSAVLFQSSIDGSSRSISVEISSKVHVNPQFSVFNRTPWSRSVKRLSAELINPLSAELVVVVSSPQRRTRKKKQLLTLIRDFAAEKSQGERRVSDLKNRVGELRSEIEIATANIEEAMKRKNGPTAAIKCLHDSDSFVDVNFVGDVCLKVRKAEVVLREESPNEVRAGYEEFKTNVHALFLAVRNSNVALVRKLLSIGADVNQKLFKGYSTTIAVRDTPGDKRSLFDHVTCNISASVDDVNIPGALALDVIEQAEVEVERLDQLKASKMKEIVFKRQTELEEIFSLAHIEIDRYRSC
ncbi:65-kDa microtubule-associated protein 1-like [Ipomoea triloba]|uniref:65-kDa microtubule-associated protein 1-like n=1 Tax=Ipomoea triloba TaxID=35885 RepID=UPI00125D828E|nr:65-kDa microtubule-associated protein 1-like [Ipomoea triloba]